MSEMRTMGKEGDVKISWNSNNDEESEAAKKIFDEKMKLSWSAFRDKGMGTKGDKIKAFDRYAERIILVPPISGG